MDKRVLIDINNHVATVKLNRPDKMNALDEAMFQGIIETAKQLTENKTIRCVVLTGAGNAFCAGMDVANFDPTGQNPMDNLVPRTHGIANKWQQVAWAWRELPVPVVAAVHGITFGGGLQIMLGADIKYIHPDTRCSILEGKWGLIPDMAGTQLMRHNIREDIIKELTYTQRIFSAAEAVEYGFATHLSNDPIADATKLAMEIASKSPDATVQAKKVLNAAPYLSAEDGLKMESIEQQKIIGQKNQMEAIFAGIQKRKGNFEDYR